MFGGITGSGADFITAYLMATGRDLFSAVVITVITDNLIDKVVTSLLAWGIVKGLPRRFTSRFPRASAVHRIKNPSWLHRTAFTCLPIPGCTACTR